jgi:stage IV sporulation protein FB
VAGTEIKVHVTFLLLLAFFAFQGYAHAGVSGAVGTTLFMVALFGCVVLHEFGHILMARRFGIHTPDVILLPIGGVARLERLPDEPRQELLIALAGPAVTLTVAGVLFAAIYGATGAAPSFLASLQESAPFPNQLMAVNLWLLLFNLLPAFPMDGGRVLRSLLASRWGLVRATRIAAGVGKVLAVGMGMAGLLAGNPILMLIALFVFVGAGAEAAAVEARTAARDLRVNNVMVTRFQSIPVHARLQDAVELLLASEQREFPVVDNLGRLEGLLTRDRLIRGLSERGPQSGVAESMVAPVPTLKADLDLESALERLRQSGVPALPVLDAAGALIGLLTLDNISDLLLVRRAVGTRP